MTDEKLKKKIRGVLKNGFFKDVDDLVDRHHHETTLARQTAARPMSTQGFANQCGHLVGDAAAGRSRMRDHDRQTQGAAVDKAMPAVVGQQQFGNRLVRAVGGGG